MRKYDTLKHNLNIAKNLLLAVKLFNYLINIARCIANSICQVACKLELHCTLQILNK